MDLPGEVWKGYGLSWSVCRAGSEEEGEDEMQLEVEGSGTPRETT